MADGTANIKIAIPSGEKNSPNDDVIFGHGEAAKQVDDEPYKKLAKMFRLAFWLRHKRITTETNHSSSTLQP